MIFLTSTPAQDFFVSRHPQRHEGMVIRLEMLTAIPKEPLPENLEDYADYLWLPYYDCWGILAFALELRKRFPALKFRYYYESLLSYIMQDDFRKECLARFGKRALSDDELSGHFLGIREIDREFGMPGIPGAPDYDDLFDDLSAETPPSLNDASSLFLGQPLVQSMTLSQQDYFGALWNLCRQGRIDVYLAHPRETILPDFLPVVRLQRPIECYSRGLSGKRFVTVFSTSITRFLLAGEDVDIIDIPREAFSMSVYAHRVYDWLLTMVQDPSPELCELHW